MLEYMFTTDIFNDCIERVAPAVVYTVSCEVMKICVSQLYTKGGVQKKREFRVGMGQRVGDGRKGLYIEK